MSRWSPRTSGASCSASRRTAASLRLPAASGVLLAGCVIVDLAGSAAMSPAPRADEDSEDVVKTVVLDTGAQHAPLLNPAGQSRVAQRHSGQNLDAQSHVGR